MEATREHINPGDDRGYLTRRLSMRRFDSVYHFHPEYELTWIQSSSGRILVGDYLGPFGPGHLALMGPNLTHWYYNDPRLKGGRDWSRALLIQFPREFLGDSLLGQPDMRVVDKLLKQSARGILFPPPGREVKALLNSIFAASGPARAVQLIQLLDQLGRTKQSRLMASPQHARQPVPAGSRRLTRVLAYIQNHYTERIDLEKLSRLAHMTPSAFSRFFHKRMGLPVSRYVLLYRLTTAARELVETRRTISEIAYSVGFNNLTHFNRQFKQWKNQTPTEFRRCLITD